jgi:hypothetical protein
MLTEFESIVNEKQAMLAQIEFLKKCATQWKAAPMREETNRNTLTQLVLTIYYLKEGLQELYRHENNFQQSKLGPLTTKEINLKQQDVMNILDGIYRPLVNLSYKIQLLNKESLWDSIDNICQSVAQL